MSYETDLKLLEAYLDDALTADQVQRIDARLSRESALLAALDELRAQRAVRAVVWRTMQPASATLARFARTTCCSLRHLDRSMHGSTKLRGDFQRK